MAKGGFPGMGGNMQQLMKQAQKMQQDMEKMQKDLETKDYEASVGGGAVKVTVNGKKELKGIKISPDAVDTDDIEELENLIMLAFNEAFAKAEKEASGQLGKLTGGMNIPGLF